MNLVNEVMERLASFKALCYCTKEQNKYGYHPTHLPANTGAPLLLHRETFPIVKLRKRVLQHEPTGILPVSLSYPIFTASLGLPCFSGHGQSVPSNTFTTYSTKVSTWYLPGSHEVGNFYSVCVLAGLKAHICSAFYTHV